MDDKSFTRGMIIFALAALALLITLALFETGGR